MLDTDNHCGTSRHPPVLQLVYPTLQMEALSRVRKPSPQGEVAVQFPVPHSALHLVPHSTRLQPVCSLTLDKTFLQQLILAICISEFPTSDLCAKGFSSVNSLTGRENGHNQDLQTTTLVWLQSTERTRNPFALKNNEKSHSIHRRMGQK